jgi:hypothetical protein
MVPSAAFRYRPPVAEAQRGWSLAHLFMPRMRRDRDSAPATPDGSRPLYVLKDGAPEPVYVKPGATDGEMTEILSGLQAGDQVITGEGSARRGNGQSAPMTALIRFEKVWKTYGKGEARVNALAGVDLEIARRVRRHHGTVRLGQVDGDEHHRLPRYADAGRYGFLGVDAGEARSRPPRGAAQPTISASSSRATTCCRARLRPRMSSCR